MASVSMRYPGAARPDDPITHFFHAHQESVVSGVLFLQVPSPASPMTFGDPRGMPPAEDFEQFQHLGDLGVDAEALAACNFAELSTL